MDRPISLDARSVDLAIEPPFQLGRARVDPQAHEYVIDRKSTRMQPQTLKVLIALRDKSGAVVGRDELIDRCWGGRIVGDDVINRCISLLRPFAAESGGFRIETVPRAGYRLVESESRSSPKRRWIPTAAVTAAAFAGIAVVAWSLAHRAPIRQGVPPAPTMTVVPFTADSNDPVERELARTTPISISHMLSESGLPVILAQSRAEAAAKSDFIISGNVQRSPGSVGVTVQMNATGGGTMVFSHDFDAPLAKSADLPDQVGAVFAGELAWTGAEMLLDRRHPLDPQIASELMKGISLTVEHSDVLRAYQIARRIAPMAPNSAIAQLVLAVDTGFSIGEIPLEERASALAVGRRASERALALAPEFGDVYITWCQLHSPVRMGECETRLRSAMRIDPSSSFVPGYLSSLLYNAGRIDEAVDLARVSLANDPYKPAKLARMIEMLEVSRQSGEAEEVFEKSRRLWPNSGQARWTRLLGMAEGANYEAIASAADPTEDSGMIDAAVLQSLLAARQRHDLTVAKRACNGSGLEALTLSLCMTTLADLGDLDGSFAIARSLYPSLLAPKADEDRVWLDHPSGFPIAMLSAPAGKSMRTDSRFLVLARGLGLLDYWRSGRMPDFCTKAHEPECRQIAASR